MAAGNDLKVLVSGMKRRVVLHAAWSKPVKQLLLRGLAWRIDQVAMPSLLVWLTATAAEHAEPAVAHLGFEDCLQSDPKQSSRQ